MLPTGHLVAFALLSYLLIVIPGPNVLFVISRSLQLGRAAGLAAVAGGLMGVYAQVIAVAFGIGALVERSVAIFTIIKLAARRIWFTSACRPYGIAGRSRRRSTVRPQRRAPAGCCVMGSWLA